MSASIRDAVSSNRSLSCAGISCLITAYNQDFLKKRSNVLVCLRKITKFFTFFQQTLEIVTILTLSSNIINSKKHGFVQIFLELKKK